MFIPGYVNYGHCIVQTDLALEVCDNYKEYHNGN